jgi:beta-barrel assembly-enhancing protease
VSFRPALGRLLLVALAVSACATRVAPIGVDARPFTPDADERLLWAQAEREAAALVKRVRLYDDPALTAYLARLGERLTPDALRAVGGPDLRFSVIRDPTLNVFALPDGRVFVHTGLLAAVESEAQLALILAGELAHVVLRHALVAARGGRAAPPRYAGVGALSPAAGAILGSPALLATQAAILGYGARADGEAEAGALASVVRGGWDATQAREMYEALAREASGRGALEIFLLGSPARLRARSQAMRRLSEVQRPPAGAIWTSGEFETYRVVVTRENAVEDIRAGRFALARRQLDRVLAAAPADATAHVIDGDLHRLQAQRAASTQERDTEVEAALRGYARALALDPARAEVHRQLGLLYYQLGDAARARAELQEYLRLADGAADARRVAEYVRELAR